MTKRSLPPAVFRSTVRAAPANAGKPAGPAAKPETRYEATDELGQGGMGRVARGIDRFLGREVALKRSLSDDPAMLEALLREAEIAARLQHPSIVTIHDVAYDDGGPFVVMRLVDGVPLRELVSAARDLSERLCLLPRIAQAIDAVAHAHRNNVVHRDLKPDNIIVAELGDTVVIDWGLAIAETDPFSGKRVGTPGFMAPEQERGDPVDARADVFALGTTLYWMLAGAAPVAGTRLVDVEPGVPRDLATIVETARAAAPEARYRSAVELAAELQRFIAGQLVGAHHYTWLARVDRQIRRHRIAFAVGATVTVAAAIAGALAIRNIVAAKADAEAAQQREAHRADEVLLGQARTAAATDPARAIALLDLRSVGVDDAARMIALDAVTRGVAHAWRPHARPTTGVAVLADGRVVSVATDRALLRERDGSLREVARAPGAILAVADGFAIVAGVEVQLFDGTATIRKRWPVTGRVELAARGRWLAWHDRDGIVAYALDDGTTRTSRGAARDLALDPQARWLAIARDDGVDVLDLASGATTRLAPTAAEHVAWSASGTRLAAGARDGVREWDARDWTRPAVTFPPAPMTVLVYRGEAVVVRDAYGCARELRAPLIGFGCADDALTSFAAEPGRFAIAVGTQLTLFDGARAIPLAGSPGTIDRIALDPAGRRVAVGTREGFVAVWDMPPIPARLAARVYTADMLDDGTPIVDTGSELVALGRDGARRRIAALPPDEPARGLLPISNELVLVDDPFRHRVRVLHLATGEIVQDFETAGASVHDDHELIVRDGDRVAAVDLRSGARRIVAEHAGTLARIGGGRGTMAAAWNDGHIWWQDRAGRDHTADAGCVPDGFGVHDDTSIELACGRTLVKLGAARTVIAELDAPIKDWVDTAYGHLVSTHDNAVWLVNSVRTQLAGPSHVGPALAETRFVTANRNSITLHDLATGTSVPIAQLADVDRVGITVDGRGVVAASMNAVLRWDDPVPTEIGSWAAWRARLTNARLASPAAAIRWP